LFTPNVFNAANISLRQTKIVFNFVFTFPRKKAHVYKNLATYSSCVWIETVDWNGNDITCGKIQERERI